MLVVNLFQERDIKFFTETEENSAMMAPRAGVPYFLWFARFINSDDMSSRSLLHVRVMLHEGHQLYYYTCSLHLVGFAAGRYQDSYKLNLTIFKLIMDSLIRHLNCPNLNTEFLFFAQTTNIVIISYENYEIRMIMCAIFWCSLWLYQPLYNCSLPQCCR